MPARGRVQAQHHQPALGAQLAEEIEHEADIAVLQVELRLVEQMHHRVPWSATPCSKADGTSLRNRRT